MIMINVRALLFVVALTFPAVSTLDLLIFSQFTACVVEGKEVQSEVAVLIFWKIIDGLKGVL
jgi:hypothetical protein